MPFTYWSGVEVSTERTLGGGRVDIFSEEEILAAFRQGRVRCTPQRYTILEYLNRNPMHPTAEEIYQAINRTDPRATLATVYKSP